MNDQANTVTLDRATFDRILEALRFSAVASSSTELLRASERCALLLIDLSADGLAWGGCDE